jgi:predicted DNA-binding transcriptional regulator YafY
MKQSPATQSTLETCWTVSAFCDNRVTALLRALCRLRSFPSLASVSKAAQRTIRIRHHRQHAESLYLQINSCTMRLYENNNPSGDKNIVKILYSFARLLTLVSARARAICDVIKSNVNIVVMGTIGKK